MQTELKDGWNRQPWHIVEFCKQQVAKDGLQLKYVPEIIRFHPREGYLICFAAVQQCGLALAYVPVEFHTASLLDIAVQSHGLALSYMSREERTLQRCNWAVKKHGLALAYVPENLRNGPLCLAAAQQNREALPLIPNQFRWSIIRRVI